MKYLLEEFRPLKLQVTQVLWQTHLQLSTMSNSVLPRNFSQPAKLEIYGPAH